MFSVMQADNSYIVSGPKLPEYKNTTSSKNDFFFMFFFAS